MEYRAHDKSNIEKVEQYLKSEFGNGINNERSIYNDKLCVRYWGGINTNFMCLEKCYDDYYKLYVCSEKGEETKQFYKKMVVGDEYNN